MKPKERINVIPSHRYNKFKPEQRTRLFLWGHPEAQGRKGNALRVATFNINNINKRLDNLLAWLSKAEPDVVKSPRAQGRTGSLSRECLSDSRVRSSLARGALLERRGHSRATPRSRADAHKFAGRFRGS